MDQEHIDALLQRYLVLLDEYTQLRTRLSQLQSGVFQNIARANFSAERGLRYGQDQYDDRMQALRTLRIDFENENGTIDSTSSAPIFTIVDATAPAVPKQDPIELDPKQHDASAEDGDSDSETGDSETGDRKATGNDEPPESETANAEETEKRQQQEQKDAAKARAARNPLRWFGVLVPPPLRAAQGLSIEAVEQVVPRLVSVNAQMLSVEIEVRRARKRRAKAEAADKATSGKGHDKSGNKSKNTKTGTESLPEGVAALEVS